MKTKEELIEEALEERAESAEYEFKSKIHGIIKDLSTHQARIREANKSIEVLQKCLKELTLEPLNVDLGIEN